MTVASLRFFGPTEGGRQTPPVTGFRPQIDIGGIHTSCVVTKLDGGEIFSFGEEHRASLALMFPDQYKVTFNVDDVVRLYEGSKLIATGRIVES